MDNQEAPMTQSSRAPSNALAPIAKILRPIIKTLIVEAAIRGVISKEKATAMIKARRLEDA